MIVIDASIVAKCILPEADSYVALALLADGAARGEVVVAPPLLPFEVTNVCWQQVQRGDVTPDEGIVALERFFALSIPLRPLSGSARRRLHTSAFAIASRHGLSATYDAHYLALAEQLQCDLWTADLRLLRSLGPHRDRVRALDEYVPEPPPDA